MKPYKAYSPLQTIQNIRKILNDLGIFTTESHVGLNGAYYSCRVVIDNNNLGLVNIGTNGKGMSKEYALASAYGELMERIQNRLLFRSMYFASVDTLKNNPSLIKLKDVLDSKNYLLNFRYYPDERQSILEGRSELMKYLKKSLPCFYSEEKRQCIEDVNYTLIEAPFYNIFNNSVDYLPIEWIRLSAGSTGLCAGNTPIEAILQGINEIFERYVLQKLYLERINPPVIPVDYFRNTAVLSLLEQLRQQYNLYYEIRDCSLGQGYPVVGLLLIDRKNNKYSFRLGADNNPIIALQRCYTEAFQGVHGMNHFFNPISFDGEDYDCKVEFNNSVNNGSGRFPSELFSETPSYVFDGFYNKIYETEKEEYENYKSFIQTKGYSLYIRDNSFLNFPAYHVFIPELSIVSLELFNSYQLISRTNTDRYKIPYEYRIKSLSKEELISFSSELENRKETQISLFPYNTGKHNSMNRHLLLSLIYFKTSRFGKAYEYMKKFLIHQQENKIIVEMYYYALRDYFYWMHHLGLKEKVSPVLIRTYGKKLAEEVIKDMNNKDSIFTNFKFPNCFDCANCMAIKECRFMEILSLDKDIQNAYQNNIKDQYGLAVL